MGTKRSIFFGCMLIAASAAASAQAPPSAATPPARIAPPSPAHASECAPMPSAPRQGTMFPQGTTIGEAREPLGDRLARSDGVLCPPAGVDPQMHAPTPDTGNTPVIPPPGSPGGNPNVRPK
jgi:hypothetical protein